MSPRAVFAAALAAAALPLAAPVAAHAESRDCVVLSNYHDDLQELMEQSRTLTNSARGAGAADDIAPDAADVHKALAIQVYGMASQLAAPVLKRQMFAWASSSEQAADYFQKLALGKSGQAERDQSRRASVAFKQGVVDYRAGNAACGL